MKKNDIQVFEQGYVQIYTGDGKGKTTAALGLALRAAGAGLSVYIVQFLKCGGYSEIRGVNALADRITVEQFGSGKFIVGPASAGDRALAEQGVAAARKALATGAHAVVILDEANVAMAMGLIAESDLLALCDEKPDHVELVLTGRGASEALMARADLVTEMRMVKHYYNRGVLARKGIES